MRAFIKGFGFGVYAAGALLGFQAVYFPLKAVAKGIAKLFKEAEDDQKTDDGSTSDDILK